MKSVLILVALLSLSTLATANHYKASVIIKSSAHKPIGVRLDGVASDYPKSRHKFDHVKPGRRQLKVYRIGHHQHFEHDIPQLVFHGYVHAKQGFVMVYILHHGQLRLEAQRPLHTPDGACNIHGGNNCGCPGHPSGGHHDYQHDYGHYNGSYNSCDLNCSGNCGHHQGGWPFQGCGEGYNGHNNHSPYYNSQGPHHGGNPFQGYGQGYDDYDYDDPFYNGYDPHQDNYVHRMPISSNNFNDLRRRMDQQITDERKVDYAINILSGKWVTTSQVAKLIDDLFFERSMLRLAQNLYEKTVDKENFHELADQFYFQSSKQDLQEYITSEAGK